MSKKTLLVRSTAHTALTLMEPNPNPEKPGDAPALRSVVIASSGQPGRAAVTTLEGDDAEVFAAWAKANKNHDLITTGVLTEGEEEDGEEKWGHEAFLPEAEGSGSTVKEKAGRVKASQMTEKGPGKANDGPGEPRHASQPGNAEPNKGAGASGGGESAAPAVNATKSVAAGKDAATN